MFVIAEGSRIPCTSFILALLCEGRHTWRICITHVYGPAVRLLDASPVWSLQCVSAVLLVQRQLHKHLSLCILMHMMKWGLCVPHSSEMEVAQCDIIKRYTTYAVVTLVRVAGKNHSLRLVSAQASGRGCLAQPAPVSALSACSSWVYVQVWNLPRRSTSFTPLAEQGFRCLLFDVCCAEA